jgi:hypothetical protein
MQKQPESTVSEVTVRREGPLEAMTHFIHKHFLLILIGAYALSAVSPRFGLALRDPRRKGDLAGRQPNKPELVFLDARLPAL